MHRRARILPLLALSALSLTIGRQAVAQVPTYQVTNLGVLSGDVHSSAAAINVHGQAVGVSKRPATRTTPARDRAFLWLPAPAYGLPTGMHDLGTLGGNDSTAHGINRHGEVVGVAATPPTPTYPNGDRHPFLWLPAPTYGLSAGMHDLQALVASSGWTPGVGAYRINDAGQILGADADMKRGFLLDLNDGSITDLGSLGGRNMPGGLNNPVYDELGSLLRATEVVGASYTGPNSSYYGYRWESATGVQALNLFGSPTTSSAAAVNQQGEITGYYLNASGYSIGFLWNNGATVSLGTLGGTRSLAHALNDAAVVVGESYTSRNRANHAFRWDGVNGMKDLNALKSSTDTSGLVLTQAKGINGAGQITGTGVLKGGYQRAFILTPQ